jgi:non-ribosomal peptide synthetase component F
VEVIFNVDRDASAARFESLSLNVERIPKRALHYDLFFNFTDGSHGLLLECDFNSDLFDASTIGRWLDCFTTLLTGIITNPDQAVARLPLLSSDELNALVSAADAGMRFPQRTLCDWFEEQAARTPDNPALSFQGHHITYRELNRRANQLAQYLQSLGAKPDRLVGVYIERSDELVVAILAILKSGAAYLPIDTVYPAERVSFMLQDSGAPILVTRRVLIGTLSPSPQHVVCLDEEG